MSMFLLRQLIAVVVLPFAVTVIIPLWIGRRNAIRFTRPDTAGDVLAIAGSGICAAIGLTLVVATVYLFATVGRGTLAPWDPPREFVVRGPYRYVRNPMISGVLLILIAEALALRSAPLAQWTVLFLAINLVYIPLTEEPVLQRRFGDSYRRYTENVRRFLPRMTPWGPS
jgi:protein-S-isoprenylcysteine O-methyltransferase Ste14